MSEREVVGIRERDYCYREIILLFLGFTFGADSISEEVVGFLLYAFPDKNLCVYCLLCFIFVLVIVLDKILRSYSLNVKNLTKSMSC